MRGGLYASSQVAERRAALVRAMVALNLVALGTMYLSGQWDAAEHAKGAVDRFWYPPHYGIYFAFLVAALLAGIGLGLVMRGGRTREQLRKNGALALLATANALNVAGAPFDAWWHTTFGLDLTVWSPPHLHILVATVVAALSCTVYFLDDEPHDAPLQLLGSLAGRRAAAVVALLLALLMASFAFVEYEAGIRTVDVLRRPAWTYPLVWSGFTLFMLTVFTAATRRIGMATVVTAIYALARLGVLWFDRAVLDYQGVAAYPLLVPALAFDLALIYLWPRWGERHRRAVLGVAGLLVGALVAVFTPAYWHFRDVAPELTAVPWRSYWPLALAASVAGTFVGWWCGTALRRLRPQFTSGRQATGPVSVTQRNRQSVVE